MTPEQQADIEARIRAAREQAQECFDRALPRLGTVNRALSEWIDGREYLLPPERAGRTTAVGEAAPSD